MKCRHFQASITHKKGETRYNCLNCFESVPVDPKTAFQIYLREYFRTQDMLKRTTKW